MKIRLQVQYGISTFPFEHTGSLVGLGRGPDNTLAFPAAAGHSVDWNHARIELTPEGAFLEDQHSEAGTYLNDRRIGERTRIVLGDKIALGAGGPLLELDRLDLDGAGANDVAIILETPAAPAPRPARAPEPPAPTSSASSILGNIVVGAFALLAIALTVGVIVTVVLARRRPSVEKKVEPPPAESVAGGPTVVNPINNIRPPDPVPPVKPVDPVKSVDPTPVPEKAPDWLPSAERKDVGGYVQAAKGPPSVLLERRRNPERWGRLKPGQRVYSAGRLVSLPGYRSRVRLDSGANLELWGNIPEFSTFPPVLESAVMLNVPTPGVDLDFALERGRVYLSSTKAEGPLRVLARFQREIWDITLPDSKSQAVLELWGAWPRGVPFRREPGGPGPEHEVSLYVRGNARVELAGRTVALPDQSRLTWNSRTGAAPAPEALKRAPNWWTDRIAPDNPRRADMMLALQDYDEQLQRNDAVVDAIMTQVRESPTTPNRLLGVLLLGALDAGAPLVDCLEDRNRPDVRGAAAFVLRQWIARGRADELDLYATLCDRKFYSPEKAETVLQLLHTYSEEDVSRPQTYDRLVAYLNHEGLPVRDLALWHLTLLAPDVMKQITYRPTDPAEARVASVAQIRKLLPEGSVPKGRQKKP